MKIVKIGAFLLIIWSTISILLISYRLKEDYYPTNLYPPILQYNPVTQTKKCWQDFYDNAGFMTGTNVDGVFEEYPYYGPDKEIRETIQLDRDGKTSVFKWTNDLIAKHNLDLADFQLKVIVLSHKRIIYFIALFSSILVLIIIKLGTNYKKQLIEIKQDINTTPNNT